VNSKEFNELKEQITKVEKTVVRIETALTGYNGKAGLCEDHENLKSDFFKFRNRAMMIFFFLLGSGILGTSIWQITSWLS
jgi:hypothetical protein